ncbi:MAG: PKD domain-containing protein [Methanolinea sp.]|nr:PKD domain-containing protein [Methanolinea sp.]
MVHRIRAFSLFILICALLGSLAAPVHSDTPLPCKFFGKASILGEPAPPGSVITATIGGNERGRITTTVKGEYASDCMFGKKLVVQPLGEDIADGRLVMIEFFINGHKADQAAIYAPGTIQWLDLTVSRVPVPTPTPTPAPPDPPAANFSCAPASGYAPLQVNFSDLSGPAITGWEWEFGDGALSHERDPTHLYRFAGNYTVNLSVQSATGNSTRSVPGCVRVAAPLLSPFPGQDSLPGDPDGDGYFEDINGNGRVDYDDVVVFFLSLEWLEENLVPNPFDYNGNGRVDFDDIFSLFQEV